MASLGKGNFAIAISIMDSPKAQTSEAGEQGAFILIRSGAKKHWVPINVIANVSAVSFDTPKSAIFANPDEHNKMLLGLISHQKKHTSVHNLMIFIQVNQSLQQLGRNLAYAFLRNRPCLLIDPIQSTQIHILHHY
jgi:hypothetical protein